MTHRKGLLASLAAGLLLAALLIGWLVSDSSEAADWVPGDLFAGVAGGSYQVYSNAGVFKETITDDIGSGFTTGCAFNPSLDKLYATNFSFTKVKVFADAHPHAVIQTIDTAVTSPGGSSESVVFAANGDFYVGHPDGNDLIHKYDASGTLLDTFAAAVDFRGTDWLDLAADQKTLYYTSEGRAVQRYDTLADVQLADFAALPGSGAAFALRLLPPGDGTGGLIVADAGNIKRLDGAGAVSQTYDVAGEDSWFSMNLDPNGTSFWAGDFTTANFYRFSIGSGAVEIGPINTGTGANTLFGICLKGEPTAAKCIDHEGNPLRWCLARDVFRTPVPTTPTPTATPHVPPRGRR